MATDHSHSAQSCHSSRFSRRRNGNRLLPGPRKHALEEDEVSMVPLKRLSRKNGYRKTSVEEDTPAARLVKIEFDAAQALAEFSRIARLPIQCKPEEHSDVGLQWFGKRKRSTRSNKDTGSRDMESDSSKLRHKKSTDSFMKSTAPVHAADEEKADSLTGDREELESNTLPESSRESLLSDSRAESPSSPLPLLRIGSRTVLLGGPAASSAFQRVVPMMPARKPSPAPIRTKIEDIHIGVPHISASPAHKMTVKRKPRFIKPPTSAKLEQLQVANPLPSSDQQGQAKDLNDIGCQALTVIQSRVEALVDAAQGVEDNRQVGIGIPNGPKSTFTEMEKETRRLRRIQANRESARQTIRRKQVLCKELTKKATGLALENEGMKQKKEMLVQKLHSLKDQNCRLKHQLMILSSNDMGQDLLPQSSRKRLQAASSPPSQVPAMPFAGLPLQSFIWALTVAQASTTDAESMLHSGEMMSEIGHKSAMCTNDTQNLSLEPGGTGQHQAPTYLLCHPSGIALSHQISPSSVSKQKTVCISNVSSSPMPDYLPKKEAISVSRAGVGCSGAQSTGPSCEQESGRECANLAARDAHLVSESLDGAGLVKNASLQAEVHTRVSSQPATFKSQGSKTTVYDTCGSSVASGNAGNCFGSVTPQLAQALTSYGFTLNGSRALEWSPQACSYAGKNISAAAIAAADARRRRKQLTRSKFLQSRAFRLHR